MRICSKCGKQYPDTARFCTRDGCELSDHLELAAPKNPPTLSMGGHVGGKYQIIMPLGQGGMGTVYLAFHETLQRNVAIKLLSEELSAQMGSVKRFLAEARAASKIDNPHVMSVFDFGKDDSGRYFLAMEYVEGESLHDILAAQAPLEEHRTVHILQGIFQALRAAHAAGVIHRDLKPENVLCTESLGETDFAKVVDFGLAKIVRDVEGLGPKTDTGIILGTPHYMSPEQACGALVDARSDLYSAGVVAYEMVTGITPFEGPVTQVVLDHINTPPKRFEALACEVKASPPLESFVFRLLQKSPKDRFQSAEQCLAKLEEITTAHLEPEPDLGSLLSRTRAALQPRTLVARQSLHRLDGALTQQSSRHIGESPTAYERKSSPSPWETSALLEEVNRLSKIWERRITEVANLLWGATERPPKVVEALHKVKAHEGRAEEIETDIALLREQMAQQAERHRKAVAKQRFRRVDLIVALNEARGHTLETDATLLPSQLSDITGFGDAPTPGVGNEDESTKAVIARLEAKLREVDDTFAELAAQNDAAVGQLDQRLAAQLEALARIQNKLAPVYGNLSSWVNQQAAGRADLHEHLAALGEVAGAIQVYQVMLRSMARVG